MLATSDITPGDVFTYRSGGTLFRRRSGAGQVLGMDQNRGIVFVRVFDVSGENLRPFIEFLPLHFDAYAASRPKIVRRFDLPAGWETLKNEWDAMWRGGDAGIFTIPLGEVAENTLETVDHFREFSSVDQAFIELAYPKRSKPSGAFDTIAAYVQTATSTD